MQIYYFLSEKSIWKHKAIERDGRAYKIELRRVINRYARKFVIKVRKELLSFILSSTLFCVNITGHPNDMKTIIKFLLTDLGKGGGYVKNQYLEFKLKHIII